MLQQILQTEQLIGYILAAEVFFLVIAQIRTNALLKRSAKLRSQRKEAARLKHSKNNYKTAHFFSGHINCACNVTK